MHYSWFKKSFFLVVLGFFGSSIMAQTGREKTTKSIFSIGLGVQHGFIFAHTQEVQNTKGANPTGLEAVLSWQSNDANAYELCRCYPRQGLLMSFYDYDSEILGKSLSAAYFLEPSYKIGNQLFFSFRGALGLSYLTNPFDELSNPTNQSYSSQMSFYLALGVGVWFPLNDRLWLNPSINYNHISNGGIKQPNKGINWPTAGITLSYTPKPKPWFDPVDGPKKTFEDYKNRYDLGYFTSLRRIINDEGVRRHSMVHGLTFLVGKQVGNISMLTLGAEVYRDGGLQALLKADGLDASPVKAGVMAGHEFLLGRFQFSQRLGVYVFDQTPYYDQIYHRWGLQYQFMESLSFGFNFLAHRQVAEFIDFRVVYSFK